MEEKQCRQNLPLPYFEVCEGENGQWAVKEIALLIARCMNIAVP